MSVASDETGQAASPAKAGKTASKLKSATIRFAGDSGDGMQLAGTQFTDTSAAVGNDISTLPDFPAEIRAPAGTLAGLRVVPVPIDKLTISATKETGLGAKDANRCKNMFALGLVYWLYGRPLELTFQHIRQKFAKKPAVAEANLLALKAGYNYGEITELFTEQYHVPKAALPPGKYRKITGNEALAMGLIAASKLSGKQLVYCSYPITPASDILHNLAAEKNFDVLTFQAEDEIAAVGAAIGASFGGALGVTGTSGPGIALKSEGMALAVMTELPLVVVDVQRGGPSTGLPTKTEQADLLQVLFGRNGECPMPVIAASSPADCFAAAIEAFTVATKYMTPVVLLSDGYIANGAEPWLIPEVGRLAKITIEHPVSDGSAFMPYRRNEKLVRPWAIPGTAGLEHRIGGLEKQDVTGGVSYDPQNHEHMVRTRAAKVAGIEPVGEDLLWTGQSSGDLLIVGWGSTHGAIKAATLQLQGEGLAVSSVHIRYLNPLPGRIGEMMRSFRHVLVPELNLGQLRLLLRAKFLVDAKGLNKVRGQPFTIAEVVRGARALMSGAATNGEVAMGSDGTGAASEGMGG
jgi:2-oxoglutarate/2-oxoacid ferredoxin oxidoreductase subunit alpha